VRLRGPIVHAVQWSATTSSLSCAEGDVAIHVARVKPEGSAPAVKILHHLAICCARERIRIQNPYFPARPGGDRGAGPRGRPWGSTSASWGPQLTRRTCRSCSTPRTATSSDACPWECGFSSTRRPCSIRRS
jgi:hypothetical protein